MNERWEQNEKPLHGMGDFDGIMIFRLLRDDQEIAGFSFPIQGFGKPDDERSIGIEVARLSIHADQVTFDQVFNFLDCAPGISDDAREFLRSLKSNLFRIPEESINASLSVLGSKRKSTSSDLWFFTYAVSEYWAEVETQETVERAEINSLPEGDCH